MDEAAILAELTRTGALLEGHFQLRSGRHSNRYFQAALVLQHTTVADRLCGALAARFAAADIATVIAPAVGGIVVGQEVARHLGVRAIFAEKDEASGLVLRRGFTLDPGERVLVAEDVITQGGRVRQTIELVQAHGAVAVGVAVLVDRSDGTVDLGVPVQSLVRLELETYAPDACPLCRAGVQIEKPGSK